MNPLDSLYRDLIMDHARHPQGKGLQDPFDGESFQVNPTCGDQVRLRVDLDNTGEQPKLAQVSWDGQGCSISQASVSMMKDLVEGEDLDQVAHLEEIFGRLMHSRGQGIDPDEAALLGDAEALEGTSRYPMRVKCALLGWMALKDAVAKAQAGDNSPAGAPEGI
ncbi:MAG: SUF system NifU family Fe-S cluster assembly protein [Bifidobacteriaceae bacterium]|jgi:nitrogen fixation NifU-like protein|nr:SUF system NifU family Fe-S cluster assembly protein [Bifidobacteriaceae bacterium]